MTAACVLVLNAGSATLKATVLEPPDPTPRFAQTADWAADGGAAATGPALDDVLRGMAAAGIEPDGLQAVGHRVVHGGERFTGPAVLDDVALRALDELAPLAPLHNPVAVATVRDARARLPSVPHVGAFDTAFHATLPAAARCYPIPTDWSHAFGIRRFGFHGLSVAWSLGRAGELLDRSPASLGLVVAHLGGGCSVTAVDGGRSVDTSMGMTPLEGPMMATRAGSIDPGIVFHLLRAGLEPDDIERGLDRRSGLAGVGGSADMRTLLAAETEGDAAAALAIEMFVRRVAAAIAASATTLARVDALVFTGGIGSGSAVVRARICERLRILGVPDVPPDPPSDRGDDDDGVVAGHASGPAVLCVHAREDLIIAEQVFDLLAAQRPA